MANKKDIKILDLYCGLGGWPKGFLEKGYDVTGYDIVDFSEYYPGRFIQGDLLKINDFEHYDVIVASPPCTDFSKSSFPKTWKSVVKYPPDIDLAKKLFNRVYEIVDIVKPEYFIIENVRGAVKYMGKEKMHIGSRYFWGDFPEFEVSDKSDIYGKWKVSPGKMRPAIRSKIPESISRSFASAVIKKL